MARAPAMAPATPAPAMPATLQGTLHGPKHGSWQMASIVNQHAHRAHGHPTAPTHRATSATAATSATSTMHHATHPLHPHLHREFREWAALTSHELQDGCDTFDYYWDAAWPSSGSSGSSMSLPEEPQEILVVNSMQSKAFTSLCWDLTMAELVAFDAEWVPDLEDSDHPISVTCKCLEKIYSKSTVIYKWIRSIRSRSKGLK